MGRSRLIRYTVEVTTDRGLWTPSEWRARSQGQIPANGKPTNENLAQWVKVYEESTLPSGCNSHLGSTLILTARIKDQHTGATLATYTREPSVFEVL